MTSEEQLNENVVCNRTVKPFTSFEQIQEENHREFAAGDKVWWLNANKNGDYRQIAEIIENLGSVWGLGVAYRIRVFGSYKGFDNKDHVTSWEHKKPVGFRDLRLRTEG